MDRAGAEMVVYVSMAFGNPYGDRGDGETVVAVRLLADMGVEQISLADTAGVAGAEQIEELVGSGDGGGDGSGDWGAPACAAG